MNGARTLTSWRTSLGEKRVDVAVGLLTWEFDACGIFGIARGHVGNKAQMPKQSKA
jgi:hypothetical protein